MHQEEQGQGCLKHVVPVYVMYHGMVDSIWHSCSMMTVRHIGQHKGASAHQLGNIRMAWPTYQYCYQTRWESGSWEDLAHTGSIAPWKISTSLFYFSCPVAVQSRTGFP